jgi:hypothetical protein
MHKSRLADVRITADSGRIADISGRLKKCHRTNPLTRERAAREFIAWTERRSAAQGGPVR